ncbi:eCIS core domain-containing protein [Streptomyces sp. 372A]
MRTKMEARFGADFSDVRIHDDSAAHTSAAEIGARAYTSGEHVAIGRGGADEHTLAHELTHVIQQRRGPVAGADSGTGLSLSDPSDRFEREAEAMATRVMRESAQDSVPRPATAALTGGTTASAPVQRARDKGSKEKKDPWKPGAGPADAQAGGRSLSLNQAEVQERMGYVCKLIYGSRLDTAAAASMQEWLGELKLNGLCGGWVRIHQQDPLWLEPMWEALVAWQPEGNQGEPVAGDLKELAKLLQARGVGDVGDEVKEVVIAVNTAWNVMRSLEPEAGYRDVHDLLGDSTVAPKAYDAWETGTRKKIECTVDEAGEKLAAHIMHATHFSQGKGSAEHYARIETPTHHMGVRLKRDNNGRQVMVCETEETGILPCTSFEEIATTLQNGCGRNNEEMIELEVTISTK